MNHSQLAILITGLMSLVFAAGAAGQEKAHSTLLRTPGQFASIQSAIDAAKPGDTVLAAPGTYRERLRLKPGVTVKSEGDDTKGALGLKRAESTILDCAGGDGAGVEMAEGATLDGFTVIGVGDYDDALWRRHFDTRGAEQVHEQIGQPGAPGIAVNCNGAVLNNIVHHIGYTGIAVTGAPEREVSPRIVGNVCHRNMGGGIGSMGGSTALIEGNTCFENFYAGIGHIGSSPVVRNNICHDNIRAGIGISEGSSPTVTGNRCYKNRRAGIGIRTGKTTRPIVSHNECSNNGMAGIGVEEGARPRIVKNRILGNRLVAIGVTGHSEATIEDNELAREGGAPPMIAVLDESRATISGNTIRGGGVAGVLVQGSAEIRGNRFINGASRAGKATNGAVWAHPGSEVVFNGNQIENWPRALSAKNPATIVAKDNRVSGFKGVAIVVIDPKQPAVVSGNIAVSDDPKARSVEVSGPASAVTGNELRRPAAKR